MKKTLLLVLFFNLTMVLHAQGTKMTFTIAGTSIDLIYQAQEYEAEITTNKKSEGLEIATITFKSDKGFIPENVSLKWKVPSINISGYWSSQAFLDKTITPDWGPAQVTSMLAREAPVLCLFGYDDVNRQTFAVSDALNTIITSTAVKEENGMIYNEIKLFTEKHEKISEYSIQLRLDTRPINYSYVLKDVGLWWESFPLYKPAPVPSAAKLPVYSTWYSYHQNVTKETILKEAGQAKAMGYETIIVDDGWQTLDSNRGYAYTGDWKPERIPEMKELAKKIHEMDMKLMLWYAVPFVGENSNAYEKMKGKFLDYWEGQGTYVLDPRYPEVRKFIIDNYVKAVEEWNLDGFKLDFIGRFRANKDTELVAENGRDFASVNVATDQLMTDLMKSLREIKPEILIEFRQPYIGPLMKKYGNMLRASDCPNLAMVNRVETTDLRLISGRTAVHSDMLMWHYEEPVDVAALQFLNVLFSVPQISVRLADIPEDHFEMIRFFTNYWLKNRDVLIDGEFLAENPLMNYTLIQGKSKNKIITSIFNDRIVPFNSALGLDQDIINAKSSKDIVVNNTSESKKYKCVIHDCMGNTISDEQIELMGGISIFEVPPSGIIQFVGL
ncbi:MAG TPA: glycoside hydrolase family 36 protein [Pricia sp.]|nr:glycoside hydrolase family 36 protein [Pricia sp.]